MKGLPKTKRCNSFAFTVSVRIRCICETALISDIRIELQTPVLILPPWICETVLLSDFERLHSPAILLLAVVVVVVVVVVVIVIAADDAE